ncbi:RNA polymerase sigma factor, sigma-70 family [Gottschalkia acidurici 9a]|uniref:RNA polymerase sigma factor, sigma-70 family n=1 Tax=Gottschalkia acidurici (strain ATCC 7906 / DSM 604 / BCRC 14475 / CIP 104303 / KCTC 5404 / NCIMB 10678 / 9a) TaxID=1128398 RepID=K0AX01_GOTA9|nr:sigma-70 family RNA polymerase sigma factor [Gottschalkia acidurici]AFS77307.1 RNA polymerase sigma factor, sigma-70 family [Gottschalkia acidurici 9a]
MYIKINHFYEQIKSGGPIDSKYKEEILEDLKPLIISSIKKYYNNYQMYDDLIQEGYEVILTILQEKKLESGKHFLGYIKNALRFHYLDKHKIKESSISINHNISDGENLELVDMLEDPNLTQDNIIVKKEEQRELWNSLLELTERQRDIVILFYVEEKSINYIAKKLGISYRTVVNTKTTALKKLFTLNER